MGYGRSADRVAGVMSRLLHLRGAKQNTVGYLHRYLDLAPVVRALAQRGEMRAETFHYVDGQDSAKVQDTDSEWMLVTRNDSFFDDKVVKAAISPASNTRVIEWTDQYSNLSDILQW